MRTCKVCKEEKPLNEENFSIVKNKSGYGKPEYFRHQCRECELERNRKYYADNIEAQRARVKKYHLEVKHGLGEGGYDRMLEAQEGRCKICGTDSPGKTVKYFSVDHDHKHCPGKWGCPECVRGLLCNACNIGLGAFADDIERLEAAVAYLRLV